MSFSRLNIDTSGRANLVSGGVDLFADRPVYGYGSGSFPRAYREHGRQRPGAVSISHTEPVTVAAEQGLVGLAAYVALLVAALWTMGGGGLVRSRPAARDRRGSRRGPPCSRRSSRCSSTRWPTPASSRTRSPGCCSRSAPRSRRGRRSATALGSPVSGYLRRLATTGAAYTASSVLSKLIAVALLPLYTRYLTPADYGAAEVMFAAVVAASIVVRFGMIEALLRFYYKDDEDPTRVVAHLLRGALLVHHRRRRCSRCPSPGRSPKRCSMPDRELAPATDWCGSRSAASGC